MDSAYYEVPNKKNKNRNLSRSHTRDDLDSFFILYIKINESVDIVKIIRYIKVNKKRTPFGNTERLRKKQKE